MAEFNHEQAMLLGALSAQIKSMSEASREESRRNDEFRKAVLTQIEDLRSKQSELVNENRTLREKIEDAEPVLVQIDRWKERLVGMGILLGLFGFAIGGIVTLFWKWVAAKIGV